MCVIFVVKFIPYFFYERKLDRRRSYHAGFPEDKSDVIRSYCLVAEVMTFHKTRRSQLYGRAIF